MFGRATYAARPRRLAMEPLESRSMLAGNISAELVDGVLHITGDNSSNDLQITQTKFYSAGETWTGSTLKLSGLSRTDEATTTINGQPSVEFEGVINGVDLELNQGNDFLWVRGTETNRNPNLPGKVDIDGGLGDDHLRIYTRNLRKVNVWAGWGADNVVLSGSTFGGIEVYSNSQGGTGTFVEDTVSIVASKAYFLQVHGGIGNDQVKLVGNCHFRGQSQVALSSGRNSLVFLDGLTGSNATADRDFFATAEGGDDTIYVAGTFHDTLWVWSGPGNDFVSYSGATSDTYIDINTREGDDEVVLQGILGGGAVDGDDGDDALTRPSEINPYLALLNFEHETVI